MRKMKKAIYLLIFLVTLASCNAISQVRHIPVYTIPHADSAYKRSIPAGTEIIDLSTNKVYLLTAPVTSTSTLANTQSKIEISLNSLVQVTENGKTGWRFATVDTTNCPNIGNNAVDLTTFHSNNTGKYGDFSIATGAYTKPIGNFSFATGYATTATNEASGAFGNNTTASGNASMAFNYSTTASGRESAAFGSNTTASGDQSFVIGHYNSATGENAFCGGKGYSTGGANGIQHIASGEGSFNFSHSTGNKGSDAAADYSAIVGGTDNNVEPAAINSVVLGGSNLTAIAPNTVYTHDLNVKNNQYVDSIFSLTGNSVYVQGVTGSGWDGTSDLTLTGYTSGGGTTETGYGLNSTYGVSLLKHGKTSANDGVLGLKAWVGIGNLNQSNLLYLHGLIPTTIKLYNNTPITGTDINNTTSNSLLSGDYGSEVVVGDDNIQTVLNGKNHAPVIRTLGGDKEILTSDKAGFYRDVAFGDTIWKLYNSQDLLPIPQNNTVYAPNLTIYKSRLTTDSIFGLNNNNVWIEGLSQATSYWNKSGSFIYPAGANDVVSTNNGLVLSDAVTTTLGMIKFSNNRFQGYNGTDWVNLDNSAGQNYWSKTNGHIAPATIADSVCIGTDIPVQPFTVNGYSEFQFPSNHSGDINLVKYKRSGILEKVYSDDGTIGTLSLSGESSYVGLSYNSGNSTEFGGFASFYLNPEEGGWIQTGSNSNMVFSTGGEIKFKDLNTNYYFSASPTFFNWQTLNGSNVLGFDPTGFYMGNPDVWGIQSSPSEGIFQAQNRLRLGDVEEVAGGTWLDMDIANNTTNLYASNFSIHADGGTLFKVEDTDMGNTYTLESDWMGSDIATGFNNTLMYTFTPYNGGVQLRVANDEFVPVIMGIHNNSRDNNVQLTVYKNMAVHSEEPANSQIMYLSKDTVVIGTDISHGLYYERTGLVNGEPVMHLVNTPLSVSDDYSQSADAMIDVQGAIRVGTHKKSSTDGMIQWNGTNFQGYNGTSWVNLDETSTPQTLSLNADTLTISNGNSVTLSPAPKIGYLKITSTKSLSLTTSYQTITGYDTKTERGVTGDIANGTLTLPAIKNAIYEVTATGSATVTGESSPRYVTFDLYNQTTGASEGSYVWDISTDVTKISRSFTLPIENQNADSYIIRVKADASTSIDIAGLVVMVKRIY